MPLERRSERRSPGIGLIRYTGTESDSRAEHLTNFAISVNISKSGVSFLSLKPVERKISIRLASDRLWDSPREGVVRWCSKVAPGSYRVGVSLI
jgi:hypothetical protein